jgi:hypothetical protein
MALISKMLHCSLTRSDHERLLALARQHEMTVAEFVRQMIRRQAARRGLRKGDSVSEDETAA